MAGARLTYEQRWKRLRKWLNARTCGTRGCVMQRCEEIMPVRDEMSRLSRPQPRKETRR